MDEEVGAVTMTTLGKAIKANRKRAKMSLQDLATAAGLTKSYVWELEVGRCINPTVKAVHGLATALGIQPGIMAIWALASFKGH